MCLWCQVHTRFLTLVLFLGATHAAVYHQCIPFTRVTQESTFWLTSGRNTSVLIYNELLTLNTNIPYRITDTPIHYYSENHDFTVCGLVQFLGHYCDDFGAYTVRSTKTGTYLNTTKVDYGWFDVLEPQYYHQIVANEFIWFDNGTKISWRIPYEGNWCISIYQDGTHLYWYETGWTQSWGLLSVYEWNLFQTLTLCCLVELFFLARFALRGEDVNAKLALSTLVYHALYSFQLKTMNESQYSSGLVVILVKWFISLVEIYCISILFVSILKLKFTKKQLKLLEVSLLVRSLLAVSTSSALLHYMCTMALVSVVILSSLLSQPAKRANSKRYYYAKRSFTTVVVVVMLAKCITMFVAIVFAYTITPMKHEQGSFWVKASIIADEVTTRYWEQVGWVLHMFNLEVILWPLVLLFLAIV